jgi:drug/metabolite transporter (DMT)-like permease
MNYLLLTIFLFSTYEVVAKPILPMIDVFQLNFIRFFLGGIILLVFTFLRGTLKITKKEFAELSFLGVLNVGIIMNLLQLSLAVPGAQASITALVFSSNPIFVYLFSVLLGREKIELKRLFVTLLALLGTILLFSPSLKNGVGWNLSLVLALGASILYGLFTLLARETSIRMSSIKMNGYTFLLEA